MVWQGILMSRRALFWEGLRLAVFIFEDEFL